MEKHPTFLFYRVEEDVNDVVYQENRLCLIIFDHICSRKILNMSHFMFSQGGGIPQFVILQGGGTCG